MRQHAAYTQPTYGEGPSLRRVASELHKTRKRPDATPRHRTGGSEVAAVTALVSRAPRTLARRASSLWPALSGWKPPPAAGPSPAPHPFHTGMKRWAHQLSMPPAMAAARRVRRQPPRHSRETAQGTGVGAGADGVGRAAGSGVGLRAGTRVGGVVPSGRVGRRSPVALHLHLPRASRPRRGSSGAPP